MSRSTDHHPRRLDVFYNIYPDIELDEHDGQETIPAENSLTIFADLNPRKFELPPIEHFLPKDVMEEINYIGRTSPRPILKSYSPQRVLPTSSSNSMPYPQYLDLYRRDREISMTQTTNPCNRYGLTPLRPLPTLTHLGNGYTEVTNMHNISQIPVYIYSPPKRHLNKTRPMTNDQRCDRDCLQQSSSSQPFRRDSTYELPSANTLDNSTVCQENINNHLNIPMEPATLGTLLSDPNRRQLNNGSNQYYFQSQVATPKPDMSINVSSDFPKDQVASNIGSLESTLQAATDVFDGNWDGAFENIETTENPSIHEINPSIQQLNSTICLPLEYLQNNTSYNNGNCINRFQTSCPVESNVSKVNQANLNNTNNGEYATPYLPVPDINGEVNGVNVMVNPKAYQNGGSDNTIAKGLNYFPVTYNPANSEVDKMTNEFENMYLSTNATESLSRNGNNKPQFKYVPNNPKFGQTNGKLNNVGFSPQTNSYKSTGSVANNTAPIGFCQLSNGDYHYVPAPPGFEHLVHATTNDEYGTRCIPPTNGFVHANGVAKNGNKKFQPQSKPPRKFASINDKTNNGYPFPMQYTTLPPSERNQMNGAVGYDINGYPPQSVQDSQIKGRLPTQYIPGNGTEPHSYDVPFNVLPNNNFNKVNGGVDNVYRGQRYTEPGQTVNNPYNYEPGTTNMNHVNGYCINDHPADPFSPYATELTPASNDNNKYGIPSESFVPNNIQVSVPKSSYAEALVRSQPENAEINVTMPIIDNFIPNKPNTESEQKYLKNWPIPSRFKKQDIAAKKSPVTSSSSESAGYPQHEDKQENNCKPKSAKVNGPTKQCKLTSPKQKDPATSGSSNSAVESQHEEKQQKNHKPKKAKANGPTKQCEPTFPKRKGPAKSVSSGSARQTQHEEKRQKNHKLKKVKANGPSKQGERTSPKRKGAATSTSSESAGQAQHKDKQKNRKHKKAKSRPSRR